MRRSRTAPEPRGDLVEGGAQPVDPQQERLHRHPRRGPRHRLEFLDRPNRAEGVDGRHREHRHGLDLRPDALDRVTDLGLARAQCLERRRQRTPALERGAPHPVDAFEFDPQRRRLDGERTPLPRCTTGGIGAGPSGGAALHVVTELAGEPFCDREIGAGRGAVGGEGGMCRLGAGDRRLHAIEDPTQQRCSGAEVGGDGCAVVVGDRLGAERHGLCGVGTDRVDAGADRLAAQERRSDVERRSLPALLPLRIYAG